MLYVGDGCLNGRNFRRSIITCWNFRTWKIIVLYDSNNISIEGNTDIAFREDVAKRYEAYGWQVIKVA